MIDMIEITSDPIESSLVLKAAQSDCSGAVVLFLGTTRQFTQGRETGQLEYECYHAMAIKKMNQLKHQAIERWKLEGCAMVHRVGVVPVGEASVAIAVSSPHRKEAFDAAEWLINELKKEVPIWKKEYYADGSEEWQHPTSCEVESP